MDCKKEILNLIQSGVESDIVDFKEKYYHFSKKYDLIKDIISFSNSLSFTNKYIIFGIADSNRQVIGVDECTIPDISDINQVIKEYCDPFIFVELVKCQIQQKSIVAMVIKDTNMNQPYTVAKDFQYNSKVFLRAGDIYIRKSANNFRALRSDIEEIYKKRIVVDITVPYKKIFLRTVCFGRTTKEECCIPINIINDTENSFLIDRIMLKWNYDDLIVESKVDYIAEDKRKFEEKLVEIAQKPFSLSAKCQEKQTLYFHVSEEFLGIIKSRQILKQKLRIQISMYDLKKNEYKCDFFAEEIIFD